MQTGRVGKAAVWRLRHLALCALQVARDAGVFGPVQHGADLLTQFQSCSPDETRGLPPDPDEDVRPAVQDVNTFGVQQRLELKRPARNGGTSEATAHFPTRFVSP